MLKNLLLILLTVCLNTGGQFLMKAGVNRVGKISLFNNFFNSIFKALTSGLVIGGFGFYVVSAMLWIIILSRAELSWAFPLVSLSYVITAIVAPIVLHESFSVQRFLGTLVIVVGVFIVYRTY
jgi:drug/metabolite transporter (DMT)-like permease